MIDFTEIQTFDVLPETKVLNNANLLLTKENKYLKNALTYLIVGLLIYWAYKHYKPDNKKGSNNLDVSL